MQPAHPSTPHHVNASQWLGLVAWLAITFAAAAIGSMASINAADFYLQLERPAWAPPAALFGPVWSVLYLMMGMSAWFVWREYGWSHAHVALTVYVVQLVLNALWSWLFFEWHEGKLAVLEVLVLWGAIALNLIMFARAHRIAGLLLVPYLAWVTFAAALTYTLWRMNPDLLA